MDNANFMTELFLSMVIFMPGVILLAGFALVGIAMMFEKMVPGKGKKALQKAEGTNPPAGSVVNDLKESLAYEEQNDKRAKG